MTFALPKTNFALPQPIASPPDVANPQVDRILVAQGTVHKGALLGIVANGGSKSVDGFIFEVVADASDYRTIQIYQCAKGVKPRVQTWMRTKKEYIKPEPKAKPAEPEQVTVNEQVAQSSLFDI